MELSSLRFDALDRDHVESDFGSDSRDFDLLPCLDALVTDPAPVQSGISVPESNDADAPDTLPESGNSNVLGMPCSDALIPDCGTFWVSGSCFELTMVAASRNEFFASVKFVDGVDICRDL